MVNTSKSAAAGALLLACAAVAAQGFPDGATTPTAQELRQLLAGKVFAVKVADGTTWRLQYNANGYMFVDTSNGFRGSGEWKAEDGKVCGHLRGRNPGCNEVRVHDGVVHLKRDSGEIIRYTPS